MIDAAVKSLAQILSPPMRSILWKAVGFALALIVVVAVALQRLLSWFATWAQTSLDGMVDPFLQTPIHIIAWIVSFAAVAGIVLGSIFLMPAVTSLIASIFVDDVAAEVEREHYPADAPGQALPVVSSTLQGVKTALLAILIYLLALPFFLFAGLGLVAFFLATAWLLSREYFELAAMRFRSPAEAKALRKRHAVTVFAAGCLIAAFVSIPIVNLATPLFGMALMVHLHKKLSGSRAELIEPEPMRRRIGT
jgi:CysZ protein